jgi:hypothetical protein
MPANGDAAKAVVTDVHYVCPELETGISVRA